MFPEANTIITFADLHRQDLLAGVVRERRAARVSNSFLQWRPLAVRVLALVSVFLGVRG